VGAPPSSSSSSMKQLSNGDDDDDDDDDEEEGGGGSVGGGGGGGGGGQAEAARDALTLVRAVELLIDKVGKAEASVDAMLERCARECVDAPLQTGSQRAAAAAYIEGGGREGGGSSSGGGGPPPSRLARSMAALSTLRLRAQRLALAVLTSPIAHTLRLIGSSELLDVWRGHTEDAELASAMLAFSAPPQSYITRAGDHLLGLPQHLEPFAEPPTLSNLSGELRGGGGEGGAAGPERGGADGGPLAWLAALGHRTVELLLVEVDRISALSSLGAKQLAADTGYVDNILASGLGLPRDARLNELAGLLTATHAELPAAVGAVKALSPALARSITSKRGVSL
jgi:hypothetical protein